MPSCANDGWRQLGGERVILFLSAIWRSRGLLALVFSCFGAVAVAQAAVVVHGLWVWNGTRIVAKPGGIEDLSDFCRSEGINEVYISVSSAGTMFGANFPRLLDRLHKQGVRVEALLDSTDADEAGAPRQKLEDRVREVVRFNGKHPEQRFDGIHLDIEPQQRPENKGPGNLRFLPGLVEAYRRVQEIAAPAGLKVSADIPSKLLKADAEQRKALLSSLPSLTLMLYEISKPEDGDSASQKEEKIRRASQRSLAMAYNGLQGPGLATMVIALRSSDYGSLLPNMLRTIDEANSTNRHYAGWARHSYNDSAAARK